MKDFARFIITIFTITILAGYAMLLVGCTPVTKPSAAQSTYQGSPTIIISPECRENCGGNTITTGQATSTAQTQSEQPITQKTESGMWKLWLAIITAAIITAIIFRKRLKELWSKIIGN